MGLSFGLCCFKRLRGMWSSVRGVVFHKDEVRITNVTLMAGLPLDSLLLSALVCSYAAVHLKTNASKAGKLLTLSCTRRAATVYCLVASAVSGPAKKTGTKNQQCYASTTGTTTSKASEGPWYNHKNRKP